MRSVALTRCLTSLVVGIPMAFATNAIALADDISFTLYNQTSVTLQELYISPSNIDDWEEDILGNDVWPAGEQGTVTIADGRQTCIYDILGIFVDGDEVDDYQVNLCELESYSFTES